MKSHHQFMLEMGKTETQELKNRIALIMEHMLKLGYVTGQTGQDNARGWTKTVDLQRIQLFSLVRRNPSLKANFNDRDKAEEITNEAYEIALARVEEDYPRFNFPKKRRISIGEALGGKLSAYLLG